MNRRMSNAIMFPSSGNHDTWENSPNVSGIFRTRPVGSCRAFRVSRGFAAGGNVFTALVSPLEASTKRDVAQRVFEPRRKTFGLRPARRRLVRVQAKDLPGKAYTVEVPWREAPLA
jgi:hypothetical protein